MKRRTKTTGEKVANLLEDVFYFFFSLFMTVGIGAPILMIILLIVRWW